MGLFGLGFDQQETRKCTLLQQTNMEVDNPLPCFVETFRECTSLVEAEFNIASWYGRRCACPHSHAVFLLGRCTLGSAGHVRLVGWSGATNQAFAWLEDGGKF